MEDCTAKQKNSTKTIQQIEMIVFIILLFLQNFALIVTKKFGIAALTVYLCILTIKYKFWRDFNKKTYISITIMIIFILTSCALNNKFNYAQIGRSIMIIFVIWSTYQYILKIKENGYKEYFLKIFYISMLMISIYGIYQLIASEFGLPIFLNVFNNNTSYGGKSLFQTYGGGWNEGYRIYATFYEPSAYALFIIIAYFFLMDEIKGYKREKILLTILTLVNLIFTFARSGLVTFVYYLAIYIAFKVVKNKKVLKKATKVLIVLLPIISLIIMNTLGLAIFNDESAKARTYSALYYLSNSYSSIVNILLGHGIGSILEIQDGTKYNGYTIEKFAHNGYIDIIYQFGWVGFTALLVFIIHWLKEHELMDNWLVLAIVFTLCCFGSMYNVESIIAMVIIVLALKGKNQIIESKEKIEKVNDSINQAKEKIEENNEKKEDILVSICCITYNQEQYIKDALEGFLKQKTKFKYEVIIHDDASTDNTANIIREYEKKYPDIIKPIYQKENQYSKGVRRILNFTFNVAQGKYIALCEGDDYWIDENKLQTQVDYMEQNKECTFCFHNAKIIDVLDGSTSSFVPNNRSVKKYMKKDNKYNVGELELLEFIPTASFMFKRENLSKLPSWFNDCFVGDWPIKLLMTSFGYAYYINKEMSVYRKNTTGSVTKKNLEKEKASIKGKIEILNKHIEFINWMDEFTEGKYKKVFDLRRAEYQTEYLLINRDNKKIIESGYLKKFSTKKKIKYIIKMYCPYIVKLYKKIKK